MSDDARSGGRDRDGSRSPAIDSADAPIHATVDPPDPSTVPDVDVLVVDNYDSFAYNLVQYVGELAGDVTVRRNDAIDVADVRALAPDGVVVSPGPGRPEDAGISAALFDEADLPVLGVCLGHQAMCAAYGATVERAPAVVHGKHSTVEHDGGGLYVGLPERVQVGRYHSLAVRRSELPSALCETAWTVQPEDEPADAASLLMGVRHRERPHYGVQFHPESILTGPVGDEDAASLAVGKRLVARFCHLVAEHVDGVDGVDSGDDEAGDDGGDEDDGEGGDDSRDGDDGEAGDHRVEPSRTAGTGDGDDAAGGDE